MSTIRATYVQHGSSPVPNITLDASGNVTVASGLAFNSSLSIPSGSVSAPGLSFVSDTDTGFYSATPNTIAIATSGTAAITVDASQRVGLGTSSPGSTIHAKGGSISTPATASDFISNATARFAVNHANEYGAYIGYASVSTDAIGIQSTTNIGSVKPLLLNPYGGNVGVGTASPGLVSGMTRYLTLAATGSGEAVGFELVGNRSSSDQTTARISFINSSAEIARINCSYQAGTTQGSLEFYTSGSERARIDSSGRLLVGTSTSASAGGVTAQHAFSHSTSSQWAAQVQHTTAAGNAPFGLAVRYTAATPNSASSDFIFCEDATALRARIYSNGGLGNYQANNVNLSDRNTKKDITLAADTWDYIKEWEIVNYRYKDQPDDADLNLGVIAQQVAKSCPEVITVFSEATEDEPEKLGVKEQQMYWMAIKALQEAVARIETLEAKVAALETP